MEVLNNIGNNLIDKVDTRFERGLIDKIDWSQRLIEVRGSRGVGKTTLLLQRARAMRSAGGKLLYASLDTPYFFNHSMFELAEQALQYGISTLFLDEVHRYPSKHKDSDWSLELKNVYDAFPELKIVYSGSSILHLYKGKGDLSRRKAAYMLPGLSFREYLRYNDVYHTAPFALNEILDNHEEMARDIARQIKPLPHFKDYLRYGYYPFYGGDTNVYIQQLNDVIGLVIDIDLPHTAAISPQAKEQLKRLLGAISTTVPYAPNMQKLAELLNITDYRTLMKYLHLLEEAQLISLLKTAGKGNKILQKPNKIYLNNTNLARALSLSQSQAGTERETFFYSQMRIVADVHYPKKGDFSINRERIFEIGGKQKNRMQIKDMPGAYVVADDVETGFGQKIPLWLFGFLY